MELIIASTNVTDTAVYLGWAPYHLQSQTTFRPIFEIVPYPPGSMLKHDFQVTRCWDGSTLAGGWGRGSHLSSAFSLQTVSFHCVYYVHTGWVKREQLSGCSNYFCPGLQSFITGSKLHNISTEPTCIVTRRAHQPKKNYNQEIQWNKPQHPRAQQQCIVYVVPLYYVTLTCSMYCK